MRKRLCAFLALSALMLGRTGSAIDLAPQMSAEEAKAFGIPPAPAELTCDQARPSMEKGGYKWKCAALTIDSKDGAGAFPGVSGDGICHGDGVDAACGVMIMDLPYDAKVDMVHYFHASNIDGLWHWNPPELDLNYSRMPRAKMLRVGNVLQVHGYVWNWSQDHRMVAMGVRYKE